MSRPTLRAAAEVAACVMAVGVLMYGPWVLARGAVWLGDAAVGYAVADLVGVAWALFVMFFLLTGKRRR